MNYLQLFPSLSYFSRDGGGQAVQVRDDHRAGDQELQHRCVHGVYCATLRRPGCRRKNNNWKTDFPEQKDGCSFEKKGSASAHINSSHSRDIVAHVHYVVALPKGKIYLQLVL